MCVCFLIDWKGIRFSKRSSKSAFGNRFASDSSTSIVSRKEFVANVSKWKSEIRDGGE